MSSPEFCFASVSNPCAPRYPASLTYDCEAQWRQVYFRPNKPLPKDAIKGVVEPHRKPFTRVVLDFIIGCVCLGIPYLFVSRMHHTGFDEESGLYSAGPMLMICACACLVVSPQTYAFPGIQ